MTRIRTAAAALALSAAVLALAGCGANGTTSDSSGSAARDLAPAAAQDQAAAPGQAAAPKAAEAKPGAPDTATGAAAAGTRMVRTADLSMQVDDLTVASARVRAIALALGGSVASETTNLGARSETLQAPARGAGEGTGPGSTAVVPGQSVIVLRVPEPDLDAAIKQVEATGKALSRTSTSQDVTGDLADLESRVSSQKTSLARIRALMGKAGSLTDVVALESELSRREADLEALEARRASLADRADLSTLTAVLRTPDAPAAEPQDDDQSFLGGLRTGWHVVVASTGVVLVVLGAVLPPALVLLVIGIPALWLRRRLLARRQQDPAGPPSWGPGPAGPGPAGPPPTYPTGPASPDSPDSPDSDPVPAGSGAGRP